MICLGVASSVVLAGCASGAPAEPTAPTTTTLGAFSPADVLGWVTPTVENGLSFVGAAVAAPTKAQRAADVRPLHTAASVSIHELGEITWGGSLVGDERKLLRALRHLVAVIALPSGRAFGVHLGSSVTEVRAALAALAHAVSHSERRH
jgi:hypothetical protein